MPCNSYFKHFQGIPPQHQISSDIVISNQSLVVQSVTRSDSGHYTCHAFNTEGEGVSNEVGSKMYKNKNIRFDLQ